MDNIILYEYDGNHGKNNLYVNLTNACTNKCRFCIRDYDVMEKDLWLEHQPTFTEFKAELDKKDLSNYKEVIFCGFGEPMLNYATLIQAAKYLREVTEMPIRLNTNGQANLFLKRDVTPEMKGLFDTVSISLNAGSKEAYNELCLPADKENAFDAVLEFTKKVKEVVPHVVMSVVDTFIDEAEIEKCRKIAEDIGVEFRVRKFES